MHSAVHIEVHVYLYLYICGHKGIKRTIFFSMRVLFFSYSWSFISHFLPSVAAVFLCPFFFPFPSTHLPGHFRALGFEPRRTPSSAASCGSSGQSLLRGCRRGRSASGLAQECWRALWPWRRQQQQ